MSRTGSRLASCSGMVHLLVLVVFTFVFSAYPLFYHEHTSRHDHTLYETEPTETAIIYDDTFR